MPSAAIGPNGMTCLTTGIASLFLFAACQQPVFHTPLFQLGDMPMLEKDTVCSPSRAKLENYRFWLLRGDWAEITARKQEEFQEEVRKRNRPGDLLDFEYSYPLTGQGRVKILESQGDTYRVRIIDLPKSPELIGKACWILEDALIDSQQPRRQP
jgi:hypothetical protein